MILLHFQLTNKIENVHDKEVEFMDRILQKYVINI